MRGVGLSKERNTGELGSGPWVLAAPVLSWT